ncbi:MAG TPA: BTAD domain-containing putative transcriptional regulator, partial [Gemmatimonadaceae bacterium]
MSAIEFRTLGTLDLRASDGRELHSLLAQPKRIALLAYLCIAEPHGYHRRDTLIGLFWPDSDQEHARSSLRKSLHLLRRALGEDAIVSRGDEEIAIDFDRISCDALSFERFVREQRFSDALDLYSGDLLNGFYVEEAPEFERWLQVQRNKFRLSAGQAALVAAEVAEKGAAYADAIGFARRSVAINATDERAIRALMRLQLKAGNRAASIETYDDFVQMLGTEYNTQPSVETQTAAQQLRQGADSFIQRTGVAAMSQADTPNPGESRTAIASRLSRSRTTMTLGVAVLGVLLLGAVATRLAHSAASNPLVRYPLVVDSAEPLVLPEPWAGRIAINPNGSVFAYASGSPNGPDHPFLRLKPRSELHALVIAGTEWPYTPFFSPDGKNVGFLREKSVWIASSNGGPPIHVSDSLTGIAGASWGSDGFIYADGFENAPLVRVEAKADAVPKWFTTLDTLKGEVDHLWPCVLPNAKGVLFTIITRDKYYIDRAPTFSIAVADIPSGKYRVLIENGSYPVYAEPGYILYVTPAQKLMAVPFDQSSMTVTGQPLVLVDGMRFSYLGGADLAVSSLGTLVYTLGPGISRYESELVWIARDGASQGLDPDWHGLLSSPTISPDGKRLAVVKSIQNVADHVWIKELDRGPA